MGCSHKTAHDHCERQPDGSRVWTCSACGKCGPWSEVWRYFGSIECSRCWMAEMDAVACSKRCAAGWPKGGTAWIEDGEVQRAAPAEPEDGT